MNKIILESFFKEINDCSPEELISIFNAVKNAVRSRLELEVGHKEVEINRLTCIKSEFNTFIQQELK